MNALERKAVVAQYLEAVSGDPCFRVAEEWLEKHATVQLSELRERFGNLDENRARYFLLAAGYEPSDADPDTYERKPWWVYPWPAPEVSRRRPREGVGIRGAEVAQ